MREWLSGVLWATVGPAEDLILTNGAPGWWLFSKDFTEAPASPENRVLPPPSFLS